MGKEFNYITDTNSVTLSGVLKKDLECIAEFNGTKLYKSEIGILRLSGIEDILPIVFSERLENFTSLKVGYYVKVEGFMHSSQYKDENYTRRTRVYVNTKSILEVHESSCDSLHENNVVLEGKLFKEPILRKSKTNKSIDLAEVILEVHRGGSKYEHIPLIVWGINAKQIVDYVKGTKVHIDGRFQSRKILRHIRGGDELESATVYEVSVKNISILD